MKMYDLTVQFNDKIETRSFYSEKAANKSLKTLKRNEKVYGFKILNHTITEREATPEEKSIHENHLKLMNEIDSI